MKIYHSITKEITYAPEVWIWDKKDGSNVRASWDKKKGFCQFGSRHKMITAETPILGQAINLMLEQEEKFAKVFHENKHKESTCFWEFLGASSLFGQHVESEKKEIFLLDLAVDKRGIILPSKFQEYSQNLNPCPLLYHGPLTPELVENIRQRKLPGMSVEGVIVKLPHGTPGLPHMFKIKTYEWLNLLKDYCKGDAELFDKLS